MAKEQNKRTVPEFPFFLDRPTPVRDVVLGDRRPLKGKEGKGLLRGPLQRSGDEPEGNGDRGGPGGLLGGNNGFRPLERLRKLRDGDETKK